MRHLNETATQRMASPDVSASSALIVMSASSLNFCESRASNFESPPAVPFISSIPAATNGTLSFPSGCDFAAPAPPAILIGNCLKSACTLLACWLTSTSRSITRLLIVLFKRSYDTNALRYEQEPKLRHELLNILWKLNCLFEARQQCQRMQSDIRYRIVEDFKNELQKERLQARRFPLSRYIDWILL